MRAMVVVKKAVLNERHLRPGRTKHSLVTGEGKSEFPPFTSLVIAQYPEDAGYYLLHLCENGQVADTYHATLDDALYQAEVEFEVKSEEWTEVNHF